MVTKNFIKTILSGLLNRIRRLELTEDEFVDLMSEMKVVEPLASNSGAIYTNNSGQIYIL